jgi:peptide-methionine (S)-S-oxide reductase
MTQYTLAGGCFWCLDAVYRRFKGVSASVCGYTGGQTVNPNYETVSSGLTGHAEAVQITFDEAIIPGDVILDLFFTIHDPTTLNKQGNDIGTQYRSAMYYENDEQKALFEAAIERAKTVWDKPIVTECVELTTFYEAEAYHQDYFNNNPGNGYCSIVIEPKITKARQKFQAYLLEND